MAKKAGDGAGRPAPSELPVAERRRNAEGAALRLLAVRERSAVEMKQRLREKGYDAETVMYVMERLQSSGLQDDRRFAEAFAEAKVRARGLAGRVVQGELRRRGIEKELAARAATRSPEEELATAMELAERRWTRLASYPSAMRRRRVAGLLARRGYSPDVCAHVLDAISGPDQDDHDERPDRDV